MSLAEAESLSPEEYSGWLRHFQKTPPGDFILHRMVAELYSLIYNLRMADTSGTQKEPWMHFPLCYPDRADEIREYVNRINNIKDRRETEARKDAMLSILDEDLESENG